MTSRAITSRRSPGGQKTSPVASGLDRAMERYQPALWIHGHMHDPVDEQLGKTRLVANPAGYAYEAKTEFDPELSIDLD